MSQNITRVPFPGGSGRVPTGAMQFDEDWPGLFIRGDDAIALLFDLERLIKVAVQHDEYFGPRSQVGKLAELIRRDVMVRGDGSLEGQSAQ